MMCVLCQGVERDSMSAIFKRSILAIFSLMFLVLGFSVNAQSEMFVIGELSNIPYLADENGVIWGRQGATRAALAELGYVEGENVRYIFDPEGFLIDNIEAAAQAIVEAEPDLIIAYGTTAAQIIKEAASGTSIPIIFVGTINPVEIGLVSSLQNPEGNITGVGSSSEAYGKQLEWLLLLDPTIQRVYIPHLVQNTMTSTTQYEASMEAIQEFAAASGVEIIVAEVPTPSEEDIAAAVTALPEANADAIMLIVGSPNGASFVEASLELGLPITTSFPIGMEAGYLLSYNITEQGVGAQAARYVDRILRGAAPSSLPVELAPNSLAVNLVTADAIGLEIPDDVLLQAEIIVRQEG
jgi:putative tryptophan/tyrosine transport system substrate-binding protein